VPVITIWYVSDATACTEPFLSSSSPFTDAVIGGSGLIHFVLVGSQVGVGVMVPQVLEVQGVGNGVAVGDIPVHELEVQGVGDGAGEGGQ
jgi:hypothetical protein